MAMEEIEKNQVKWQLTPPEEERRLHWKRSNAVAQPRGSHAARAAHHAMPMHIVLGVTGGIAAYKAPDVVRAPARRPRGCSRHPHPQCGAFRFAAVAGRGFRSRRQSIEQWGDSGHGGVDHIELARWADLAPDRAPLPQHDREACDRLADDALSTYAIAHRGTIVVAPAMNTSIAPASHRPDNLATLPRARRHRPRSRQRNPGLRR